MFGKTHSLRDSNLLNIGRIYLNRTNLRSVTAMVVVLAAAMTIIMPSLSYDRVSASRIDAAPVHLPVYFEENRGQQDGRVRYLSRGAGMEMFLTATEAV